MRLSVYKYAASIMFVFLFFTEVSILQCPFQNILFNEYSTKYLYNLKPIDPGYRGPKTVDSDFWLPTLAYFFFIVENTLELEKQTDYPRQGKILNIF